MRKMKKSKSAMKITPHEIQERANYFYDRNKEW